MPVGAPGCAGVAVTVAVKVTDSPGQDGFDEEVTVVVVLTLTIIGGLVFAVFVPSEASLAVMVRVPPVFKVTAKVFVPATNAEFPDKVGSVEVSASVSATVLTRFQFASAAFTVKLNAVPAICVVGLPVLPLALPGAADSPGTKICSFTNGPALTVSTCVAEVIVVGAVLAAVTVGFPALGSV